MKAQQARLAVSVMALAVAAALSASPVLADDEEAAALKTPTSSVEIGILNATRGANAKSGEYSGITEGAATRTATGAARGRCARRRRIRPRLGLGPVPCQAGNRAAARGLGGVREADLHGLLIFLRGAGPWPAHGTGDPAGSRAARRGPAARLPRRDRRLGAAGACSGACTPPCSNARCSPPCCW